MKSRLKKLFKKILKSVAPPPDLLVSDWADRNIILSSEYASEPGRWHTDRAPYQREIMNSFNDPLIEKIVVMSSSQVGKNAIVNNIIGYAIDNDPCPILLVEPTIKIAEDYSKRRIAPLIRDTKCLKRKVHDVKSRDSNNTILTKNFPGGSIAMVGSNSARDLASKPIRILIGDEIDGFEESAGTEGDPIDLATKRTITFQNRKIILVSTPLIKQTSRIEPEYMKGTQEKWKKECPHCGEFIYLNLYNMKFEHEKDDKNNYSVWNVRFKCPACLEEFDEYTWKAASGEWIPDNPYVKDCRSFKLNAFVSPWLSWEAIIKEWLTVKKDPERLKVFYNTMLGESWEEKGEIEDEDFLMDRREEYMAELPEGVLILTCGVDVQGNRLEYEIVGWGHERESWGIEKGVIMGSPDEDQVWQDLSDKLVQKYSFENGVRLSIACTCIDSGGHSTTKVYQFCKRNEPRRVFAIKGMGGFGLPLIHRITRTKNEKAILITLGVDEGKSNIYYRLKIKAPGAKYCHFPQNEGKGYDRTYFKGLISEKIVYRKVKGKTVPQWEKISERNEPLDLRNYATAALELLKPNFEAFEKRLKSIQNAPSQQENPSQTTRRKRRGVVHRGIEV